MMTISLFKWARLGLARSGLARSGLTCTILCVLPFAAGCGGSQSTPPTQSASGTLESPAPDDQAQPAGDQGANSGDSSSPILDANDAMTLPPETRDSSTDGESDLPASNDVIELPPSSELESSSPSKSPSTTDGSGFQLPEGNASSSSSTAGDVQFAKWPAIRKQAESTGKITVVDLWSTVCTPCVKEFPGLVHLSKTAPANVTCLSVSVDYDGRKSRPPSHYTQRVAAFLTSMKADFPNFICETPSEDVFTQLSIPSIPAVLVFDANGKLIKQFVDAGDTRGFTYESDVIPFVQSVAS